MNTSDQMDEKPLKVEQDYIFLDSKKIRLRYRDVKYVQGWADANKYLPADLDLVELKFETDPDLKLYGWIHGEDWICLKNYKKDKIIMWKKVV
jgi:hypothetical protein